MKPSNGDRRGSLNRVAPIAIIFGSSVANSKKYGNLPEEGLSWRIGRFFLVNFSFSAAWKRRGEFIFFTINELIIYLFELSCVKFSIKI